MIVEKVFCLESAPVSKWNGGGGASTTGSFNSFRSNNNNNDENSNPNSGGSFGSRNAGSGFGGNFIELVFLVARKYVFFSS